MNLKYIRIAILMVFLSQVFFSCEKDYLNVNDNPNYPTVVPGYVIMPAAVMSTTASISTRLGIPLGIWSQHYTQSNTANQFKQFDQFQLNYSDFDNEWSELYTGAINDYLNVKKFSKDKEDWSTFLMATVMEAYTYQYLVDLWDNVPYSEVGKVLYPKSDKGEDIYKALLVSIDEALAKNPGDLPANLDKYDMVFGGDISLWIQFANTLKLKINMRMYGKGNSVAAIKALVAEDNFLSENAGIASFTDADDQRNPLCEFNFHGLNTGNNLVASNTLLGYLQDNTDPRIEQFYSKNEGGLYKGLAQGDFSNTTIGAGELSLIKNDPTKPVFFISLSESYFLRAEAMLRDSKDAQELYNKGVTAAFAQYSLDASAFIADGGKYAYPTAGSVDEKLEAIIQQKWVALLQGTNSTEAYIEHVRTGFPKESDLDYGTENGYIFGQFTYPKKGVTSGVYPKRLPSSKKENKNNPNSDELVDALVPVWWNK